MVHCPLTWLLFYEVQQAALLRLIFSYLDNNSIQILLSLLLMHAEHTAMFPQVSCHMHSNAVPIMSDRQILLLLLIKSLGHMRKCKDSAETRTGLPEVGGRFEAPAEHRWKQTVNIQGKLLKCTCMPHFFLPTSRWLVVASKRNFLCLNGMRHHLSSVISIRNSVALAFSGWVWSNATFHCKFVHVHGGHVWCSKYQDANKTVNSRTYVENFH